MSSVVRESFSGPLPPPRVLAQYDEVSPGLVDRIVAMAEKQAAHRQALERIVVTGNSWLGKAGVIAGFVLGVLALLLVGFAIYRDAPLEYLAGILVAVGGLTGIYIYTRSRKTKDARNRVEQMQKLFEATTSPKLTTTSTRELPAASQSPTPTE